MSTYGTGTYGSGTYGLAEDLASETGGISERSIVSWIDPEHFARPHLLAVVVQLLANGEVVQELEVTDGSVTLDQTAATRGRCDLTLVDDGSLGLVPDSPTSALAPYGNEVRILRGIEHLSGLVELISLGIFRIEDVDVDDSGDSLQIRITGLDRSVRFISASFEEPYQITAGTNFATAIEDTLAASTAFVGIETNFAATAVVTPTVLVAEEGEDRWAFCQGLASAIGAELYFDGDGVLQLQPSSTGSPVMTIAEGESGVLIAAARRWTREGTHNRWIVTGESSADTPVRGVATDDEDPASPTYYLGDFGPSPGFWSSSFIASDDQAQAAAEAMLAKELGTTASVSFGTIVNPALEPGDVIEITRERAGISAEEHVIDQLTIPLTAEGTMSGETRARQV